MTPNDASLPATRPVLTVDLAALGRNLDRLREAAGPASVAPVVKADAYGLGATAVCRALAARGVAEVFVAYPHEGEAARDAAPGVIPYVLNGYHEEDEAAFTEARLRPVLNDEAQASAWAARGGGPCALGVDVGMNRLGVAPAAVSDLPVRTGLDPRDVVMVVAHLSHASDPSDPRNAKQIAAFEALARDAAPVLPRARFSLSASGGMWLPTSPSERVVRPGIGLYGASPTGDPADALEVVASLTAPIIALRDVPAGETVSYDGRWTAPRDSRVAVLSIGYADGYPRAMAEAGEAVLGGVRCPVVGAVTMDLTMIDVTGASVAEVGRHAELFGHALPVDEAARRGGTIGYELLAAVGPRALRRYLR